LIALAGMTHVKPPPDNAGLEALTLFWSDMGALDAEEAAALRALAAQAKAPRPAAPEAPRSVPAPAPSSRRSGANPIEDARRLAAASASIEALRQAVAGFKGCPLHAAARNTVLSDGVADAPVMLIGEAPGGEEDAAGLPFVGRSGKLLDRMLATIGLSRRTNLYITNLVYWRPPQNRNPTPEEIQVCEPFLLRQIELVRPKLVLAAGAFSAQSLLGTAEGITRLRGRRHALRKPPLDAVPCMPLLHPSYLLRRPAEKAKAWADMLAVADLCDELGVRREGAL
jgi:uracil-DNA glycosylase